MKPEMKYTPWQIACHDSSPVADGNSDVENPYGLSSSSQQAARLRPLRLTLSEVS